MIKENKTEIELSTKSKKLNDYQIKTDIPSVYAAVLPMTDEYIIGNSCEVFSVGSAGNLKKGDIYKLAGNKENQEYIAVSRIKKSIGKITPIINLDLYGKVDGEKKTIKEMKASVTMTIKKKSFKGLLTAGAQLKKSMLFVFLDDEKVWVPMSDKRSGVNKKDLFITDRDITFTAKDWPIENRMIAFGP